MYALGILKPSQGSFLLGYRSSWNRLYSEIGKSVRQLKVSCPPEAAFFSVSMVGG